MRELPAALGAFAAYKQFIIYKLVPSRSRHGKMDKFPCDFRTGLVPPKGDGGAHDPALWTDFNAASAAAVNYGPSYGVGFVFTEADPFWFLDIDNCLQADNTWSPLAQSMCQAFGGAAVEISQSGKGLHLFGTGRPPAHSCKNEPLGLEFYHTGRFVALTGTNALGDASRDFTAVLPAVIAQYFPPKDADVLGTGWTDGPCPEWRGPTDDDELIRRACRARSADAAFGNKATFEDLWNCNIEKLSRAYPDEGRPFNASQADAALAQHLAFWTGRDCERIVRLMGRSGLARDKWNREDYLPRTIINATSRQFEVLTDKVLEQPATAAPVGSSEPVRPTLVQGSTFASAEQQLSLFAGCVYVGDIHRVMVPGGNMLKPEQFKVAFGGYTFAMDNANERTSRDAWEAFTQSQVYRCPRADSSAFKPDRQPGEIIDRGGKTFVNTYWPVEVPRKVGDATPFLNHLVKLLPDPRDRLIALSYMAACVQHKGVKFQWAPLFQGIEGNGKTLLSRCVAEAVGTRYVHWPKASKLAAQFNSWMVGKIFYAVEDIYVPDHKRDVIEELKPMITGGDGLEIEGKGVDQVSADVCGNFMFNTNNRSACMKTRKDRRYAPFFTAQQRPGDLDRDGMTGSYFPKLYEWLRREGYAIVSELLHTFPIPDEYNPATSCQRAPETSSTNAAIAASVGGVEQEIAEAIEQGLPGFNGGWISSIMLERLLERIGAARRITHMRRREMLEDMGYLYHPALREGRTNTVVLPDNGKPRLFIHCTSEHVNIEVGIDVAKRYEMDNANKFELHQ